MSHFKAIILYIWLLLREVLQLTNSHIGERSKIIEDACILSSYHDLVLNFWWKKGF